MYQMNDYKKISLVVPVYNEELNVAIFFNELSNVLEECKEQFEFVFVDDGSRDRTLQEIGKLSSEKYSIVSLELSRNFGKEAALTAGIEYAKGDAVIPIDVDLQDPPELIPEMIKRWSEGADVVCPYRHNRDSDSLLKKQTANFFYSLLEKISHTPIPRNVGDFRLIDRKVIDEIILLREKRRFMKGIFAWVGYKQEFIPFTRDQRREGESKFNYWKLWNFALEGITSFSIAPLQVILYLGFLTSFMSFGYAVFIISKTLILGIDLPGYASIMVTMLFLGGVQLIAIGTLGEYIGRIYEEVKDRPIYLLKNKNK